MARGWQRSGRVGFALFVAAAAACKTEAPSPRFDPQAELKLRHDGFWSYLAATYDLDHDQRVTRAEYRRGDDSFARLDRDRDGAITRADFDRDLVLPPDLVIPIMLVNAAGGREAESVDFDTVRHGFASMDANGDGRIDRAEFDARAGTPWYGVDRFGTLLAGMDADHDGLLSIPEIEQWFLRRDADGDKKLVRREPLPGAPTIASGYFEPDQREPAPDFTATALADGKPVSLASRIGGKPLVLIFGSFT